MAAFFFSISEFFLSFCADPDIPGSRCTATARAQSARPAPRRRNRVYYTPSALKKQDVFKKKSLRIAEAREAGERRGKRWGTLERVPQTPQNFSRINLFWDGVCAGSKGNATLSNHHRIKGSGENAGGLLKESPRPPRTFIEQICCWDGVCAGSKGKATLSNRYRGTNQCRAGSDRGAGGGAPGKVN